MLALPGGFRYPLVFVFIFIAEPQPTDLCVVPPATMKGVFLCTCTHRVWVVTLDPIATTAATHRDFRKTGLKLNRMDHHYLLLGFGSGLPRGAFALARIHF